MQLKALESGASNDMAEKDQRIEDLNRVSKTIYKKLLVCSYWGTVTKYNLPSHHLITNRL